tara:strand:- start:735 stop:1055 length:321 start_codon:yes stop_codon:yes gene_type:complete
MKYVFDIDGTICSTTSGDYEQALPYTDRINKINKLYDEGNTITFQTARGMGRSNNCTVTAIAEFRDLTKKQLKEWGVKYHDLFLGKPSGDIYIDDKGVDDESFFTN